MGAEFKHPRNYSTFGELHRWHVRKPMGFQYIFEIYYIFFFMNCSHCQGL